MKHLDLTPYVKAEAIAGSVREALRAGGALGLFDAGVVAYMRRVGFQAAVVRDGLGYLDEITIPLEAARRLRYVEGFYSGKN